MNILGLISLFCYCRRSGREVCTALITGNPAFCAHRHLPLGMWSSVGLLPSFTALMAWLTHGPSSDIMQRNLDFRQCFISRARTRFYSSDLLRTGTSKHWSTGWIQRDNPGYSMAKPYHSTLQPPSLAANFCRNLAQAVVSITRCQRRLCCSISKEKQLPCSAQKDYFAASRDL